MRNLFITTCGLSLALLSQSAICVAEERSRGEFFEERIRPVLIGECFRCHGPEKTKSGLRVDSRARLLSGGDNGPSIVPGSVGDSLLLQAISGAGDVRRMPPDKPLAAATVADFETWIRNGAVWPDTPATRQAFTNARHWAFVPVQKIEPPLLDALQSKHPLDRFLEAARRKRGLVPVPEADARTLMRRLSFDLIGLPPTPNETAQFERDYTGDQKESVFAREVDRLLASPRYGERWGRHWMDVVRYADTAGDNADYPIPEVSQYRDYIIDSFNADKPFDEFIREQLAGDLLPDPQSSEKTAERIKATGFLALSRRYGTAPEELRHLTLEDTLDTVGKAFLGLTLKCARCHDHKFDPITTNDYYALYGIFASTQFPWAGAEEFQSKKLPRTHFVPLLPREEGRKILEEHRIYVEGFAGKIRGLKDLLAKAPKSDQPKINAELDSLRIQYQVAHRRGYPVNIQAAYAVSEGKPHDVAVQIAGEPTKPGNVVPRGAVAFLSSQPLKIPAGAGGRKELAEWITRRDNPLTARVIVNRLWQHHFGRGIVATSSNFGTSGSLPTHPEIIDFLAEQLVDNGWSLKSIHRLILTSRAWRLSSQSDERMAAIDTGNDFLWRQNRRRLDAEEIRDAFLTVAGRLDVHRPGPHPFPPIEKWTWTQHSQFKERYDSNHRSVYLMTQRLQRHPFLALFDGPDTNTTTDVRTSATVPTQALYLLNSPEVSSLAAAFAKRLLRERASDPDRIAWAHEVCFSHHATDAEIARGEDYLASVRSKLNGRANAEQLAWQSLSRAMLVSNAFFYVD